MRPLCKTTDECKLVRARLRDRIPCARRAAGKERRLDRGVAVLREINRIESEKNHKAKRRMTMTKGTEANALERNSAANQAGASLKTTAEHFRMLVENMKDYAIIILDPNGRIASWNPGSEVIMGYRSGEIIGQHFSRFYSNEDVQSGS